MNWQSLSRKSVKAKQGTRYCEWISIERILESLFRKHVQEPSIAIHKRCPGSEVNVYFSLSDNNTKRTAPGFPTHYAMYNRNAIAIMNYSTPLDYGMEVVVSLAIPMFLQFLSFNFHDTNTNTNTNINNCRYQPESSHVSNNNSSYSQGRLLPDP